MSNKYSFTPFRHNFTLFVSIEFSNTIHLVSVLVDSGATVNLIHNDFVQKLKIPTMSCIPSINVIAVDNKPIGPGINQQNIPSLSKLDSFTLKISFYVISSPKNQIIFGHPGLTTCDPTISWNQGKLRGWSQYCHVSQRVWKAHCYSSRVLRILRGLQQGKSNLGTSPSSIELCHRTAPKFGTSQEQSLPRFTS